ncbi:MAG: 4Fe-4S dicluster domain-containing protein [Syntrophorhabdales bacterium]|jgi:heterodisulfide reductase subunit C
MDDMTFLREMEQESNEQISACYQCYRCTNGCPALPEMDILPHRVIRLIMLGERERVLASKTIWSCLQCYACSVRCPNDIHIGHVFDTARKIAIRDKLAVSDVWTFDRLFLDSVRAHGRLYELETVMRYKLKKKDLFSDTKMGLDMMKKGRMGLFPHNIKDRAGLKNALARMAKNV